MNRKQTKYGQNGTKPTHPPPGRRVPHRNNSTGEGGVGTLEAGAGQEQEGAKEGLQGRSGTLADLATAHGPPKKKSWGNLRSLAGALEARALEERALEELALRGACEERALEGTLE